MTDDVIAAPPGRSRTGRNDRWLFDEALERARTAAYGEGEFVGQESFMLASDIIALADAAGVTEKSSVLDLCCGVAGPGSLVTREFGCDYLGVDSSEAAISIARDRAHGLSCQFEVSSIPPLPAGSYDVVLLLETMLAFPEKERLFDGVASALKAGGRFAFTVEEGQPLTHDERARMPNADTVWPITLPDLLRQLDGAGLRVRWLADCSRAHQATAHALLNSYASDAQRIAAQIGRDALADLLNSHVLWNDWLLSGRVRKFTVIAELPPRDGPTPRSRSDQQQSSPRHPSRPSYTLHAAIANAAVPSTHHSDGAPATTANATSTAAACAAHR
jgi:SAM-dependent methyltransferase